MASSDNAPLKLKNSWEILSWRSQANSDGLAWRPKNRGTWITVLCVAFIALPYLALTYTPGTFRPLLSGSSFSLKLKGFLGYDEFELEEATAILGSFAFNETFWSTQIPASFSIANKAQ